MGRWVDRARETTATSGTGTVSLGGAVAAFRTMAAAGLVTGDVINYLIEDASNAWEIGVGTYTSGAPGTITRSVKSSSNSNALLSLSGAATIEVTIAADDLNFLFCSNLL